MANVNRQIILAAMPVGLPKESDFRVAESPIPTPWRWRVPGPGHLRVD